MALELMIVQDICLQTQSLPLTLYMYSKITTTPAAQ